MAYTYEQLKYGLEECVKWGGCKGMTVEQYAKDLGVSLPKPTGLPTEYGTPPKPTEPSGEASKVPTPPGGTTGYSQTDTDSYNSYLEYIKTHTTWPVPEDIADYLANRDLWESKGDFYDLGFNNQQILDYNTFMKYASLGTPDDWYPQTLEDYLANYDKAQTQLDTWKQEYGTQLAEEEEYEAEQEEAYQEGRIAAGERYREPTRYSETYESWLGEQGQFSGALERFAETQYPSLQRQFEAGMPQETGYATPTEARAAALQRESMFQAWLPQQEASMYQKYMGQRPEQRGERLWMQAPTMRTLNW